MDARPQRPRGLQPLRDENMPPTVALAGHCRDKSIGTATIMGGLNAAAKRTVFADVSNTATNQMAGSQMYIKNAPQAYTKNAPQNENITNTFIDAAAGKDAFRRPAQRPLKALTTADSHAKAAPLTQKPSVRSDIKQAEVVPTVGFKKNTGMVYNDNSQSQDAVETQGIKDAKPVASTATLHALRQYKSQPQLKAKAPVLRRTQSRLLDASSERPREAIEPLADLVEAVYEDAVEHIVDIEKDIEQVSHPEVDSYQEEVVVLPAATATADLLPAATVDAIDQYQEDGQFATTSATIMSEPEEYWEEEEEEEVYDDQGYTTAHSFRSKGDLTTGGVTTLPYPKVTIKTLRELEAAKAYVEATRLQADIVEDAWDLSMAAEYSEDIFQYMRELENKLLPNAHYMDIQTEIQWSMRSVLMDWLVQVHHRFSLLPETLFLAVNYIDRFLSCKVVSLGKLQLVGATAILLAAKYEEINCPSLEEIVYMVDKGYTIEEVMKAERFMLTMLRWELGWPGPMSFLRRISKADDYDYETRTLAKYLIEVTIMDERFVGSPASFIAAGAHCLSRLLLRRGNWSPAHVHYSGYTWSQLKQLVGMILDCCQVPLQHHAAIFEKYGDKRFKYCSEFVQEEIQSGFTLPTHQPTVVAPFAAAQHDGTSETGPDTTYGNIDSSVAVEE
ncbi:related to G2/mitotic-specific cyclin 3 [Cephalotrichum gorgonifer]|uniref:Related to G2/mitotic-specific cyclin 3 n=1 Tax=Cephalotrichum gorgonifer TaxID=2041049 RepID=A0AAE8MTL0_9PEZI|nr:related to G2/mitotic-specific cyclin 3 [Cephalotrichum gorgonifer]